MYVKLKPSAMGNKNVICDKLLLKNAFIKLIILLVNQPLLLFTAVMKWAWLLGALYNVFAVLLLPVRKHWHLCLYGHSDDSWKMLSTWSDAFSTAHQTTQLQSSCLCLPALQSPVTVNTNNQCKVSIILKTQQNTKTETRAFLLKEFCYVLWTPMT